MLNPDLAIYHNPTKDCSWDCPFKSMCIAMEEGADWESYLDDYESRNETANGEITKWQYRLYKKYPEQYPEEYQKYCKESVDSLEEFLQKYEEEE
jgi:hypothetical protein